MPKHFRAMTALTMVMLVAFLFIIASCSLVPWAPEGAKNFVDMTTMEKSVFLMKTYNKQYDSYLELYAKGDWTDIEKEILQKKHSALKEVHPYIDMYSGYAKEGEIPPEATEAAAITALNKLLGL